MPTLQAETLYPKASAILEDLQRLKDEVTAAGNNVAGEVLIGASTIPGTYLLPKYAAAFKKKFPHIVFETRINDSTRIASAIHDKRLLMGIVGSKTFSRKIEFTSFCKDELVLAAQKDFDIPKNIALTDLTQFPFISRETGSGTRRNMEKIFTNNGFSPTNLDVVASFGSSAAIKEAVKTGLGVAIISRHAVEVELEMGWLKEVHIDNIDLTRNFYIAKLAKRTLPTQYQRFFNFLIQQGDDQTVE